MKSNNINKLYLTVYEFYQGMDSNKKNILCSGHWWDHILRVTNNVFILTKRSYLEKSHLLIAAAICHELGYVEDLENHTKISASRCYDLMLKSGFNAKEADFTSKIILASDRDIKIAENKYEKILYIADKLDLFGIEGLIRLAVEHGRKGITVHHELSLKINSRLQDWYNYMMSFGIATDLIEKKYSESKKLLKNLDEPIPLFL